jgi:aryl-phospho-beta-D-glucosidase BglC (GH1 family)
MSQDVYGDTMKMQKVTDTIWQVSWLDENAGHWRVIGVATKTSTHPIKWAAAAGNWRRDGYWTRKNAAHALLLVWLKRHPRQATSGGSEP